MPLKLFILVRLLVTCRYNAIMHPFERRFTKLRTKLILVGIWVAAIAISGVQLRVARSVRFKYAGE